MKCRGHSPVQGDEKEDDDDDDDGCCVCVCKNDTSGTTDDKDRKSSAFGGSAVKVRKSFEKSSTYVLYPLLDAFL